MKIMGLNVKATVKLETGQQINLKVESIEYETTITDSITFNDLTSAITTDSNITIRGLVTSTKLP